jgi:outer membrane biogenesis lipoprotein LolB
MKAVVAQTAAPFRTSAGSGPDVSMNASDESLSKSRPLRSRSGLILLGPAFALLALSALLLTGCAPKPKLLPQETTPENVLRCTLENQKEFETLACLVKMKIKGPEAAFSGTVEFLFRNPDTFVFYPQTFFGIGGFKAKAEKDSLTIYFPRRNEFFRGSFPDFDEASPLGWDLPLHILLQVALGRSGLSNAETGYEGREGDLFRYGSEDRSWQITYLVDSRRCRLTKACWTRQEDGNVFEAEYGGFKRKGQAEIPNVIVIRSRPRYSATLKFVERAFNKPLDDALFDLQIPADAIRVTFQSTRDD